jgi:hypothetical protein
MVFFYRKLKHTVNKAFYLIVLAGLVGWIKGQNCKNDKNEDGVESIPSSISAYFGEQVIKRRNCYPKRGMGGLPKLRIFCLVRLEKMSNKLIVNDVGYSVF